ncbi:MAG: DUF86 domain-containing protein [Ferruginibacter sp.]|nr:DUF86 domain-containing protein [Ferruginibacter sp.]
MKNKLSNKERLGHILDAIAFIERALISVDEDQFQNDFILYTAVVKWFEIIGEASYHLTKEFKKNNEEVEWIAIEGLRHILVHEYFGIDLYKVWELYKNQLEDLKIKITKLYKEIE